MKFLEGWIPDYWCRSDSRLYRFDHATGHVKVKRSGFYSVYGQVRDILQSHIFCRRCIRIQWQIQTRHNFSDFLSHVL